MEKVGIHIQPPFSFYSASSWKVDNLKAYPLKFSNIYYNCYKIHLARLYHLQLIVIALVTTGIVTLPDYEGEKVFRGFFWGWGINYSGLICLLIFTEKRKKSLEKLPSRRWSGHWLCSKEQVGQFRWASLLLSSTWDSPTLASTGDRGEHSRVKNNSSVQNGQPHQQEACTYAQREKIEKQKGDSDFSSTSFLTPF